MLGEINLNPSFLKCILECNITPQEFNVIIITPFVLGDVQGGEHMKSLQICRSCKFVLREVLQNVGLHQTTQNDRARGLTNFAKLLSEN